MFDHKSPTYSSCLSYVVTIISRVITLSGVHKHGFGNGADGPFSILMLLGIAWIWKLVLDPDTEKHISQHYEDHYRVTYISIYLFIYPA